MTTAGDGLPCAGLVHGSVSCTHHDQIQWLRGVVAVQGEMIRDLERRLRGEPFTLAALRPAPPPPAVDIEGPDYWVG